MDMMEGKGRYIYTTGCRVFPCAAVLGLRPDGAIFATRNEGNFVAASTLVQHEHQW